MKNLLVLCAFLLTLPCLAQQDDSIFELGANQSMSITGKGPGQDAAINPYAKGNSLAIVTNLDKNVFVVRTQYNGKLLKEITVGAGEKKKIVLKKGYELYLDSTLKSKAKVIFKEYSEWSVH